MICTIDILANTVVVYGTVGVLQEAHDAFDNFSALTQKEFQKMLKPCHRVYETVCVLDQIHLEYIIEDPPAYSFA